MLIIVKAIDQQGQEVTTPPLTRRHAVMKMWEFKTSGHIRIRTFVATTNEAINILEKPD